MREPDVHGDLDALVCALPRLVNGDDWLVHRGRFIRLDFVIEIEDASYFATIDHGRMIALDRKLRLTPAYELAFRADADTWRTFWQRHPPPPFHDIFAMSHRAGFRIEGNLRPLMANLLYFKDVLSAPRRLQGSSS